MSPEKKYDVVIIGAGVLGTSLAYFLSLSFRGSIAIIDREKSAGEHTTTRNTGVIHRPFYLDPEKKKVFARSAQDSYPLWRELASKFGLPWNQCGTLEIAVREQDTDTIDKYRKWSESNGMAEEEVSILDERELKSYEPNVKGFGAILSKTDTGVNFGIFTKQLMDLAVKNGVKFLSDFKVDSLSEDDGQVTIKGVRENSLETVSTDFMLNTSGGDSLRLAHILGLGRKYATLHFRGDYWRVDGTFGNSIRHNIYTVPRHQKFPFLDPHFVLRHNGVKELGPTATLVASAYDYVDHPDRHSMMLNLLERPSMPKIKLVTNREFLNLVRTEWRSSRSKEAMAERVREFIPSMSDRFLTGRGLSGVRNSLIDSQGFVPEAILERGERSYHILNYNSPGATGAPAYSTHILKTAVEEGYLKIHNSNAVSAMWSEYLCNNL